MSPRGNPGGAGGEPVRKVLMVVGALAGLLVVAGLAGALWLGLAIERGSVPDTCIVIGKTLKEKHRQVARSVVDFEDGETLVWLYAAGFLDYLSNLQFMTDRRIVSRWTEEGKPRVAQIRLSDLRKVRVMKEPDRWDDGLVFVSGVKEDEGFLLNLSGEDGLHTLAIDQMKRHLPGEKPPGTVEAEAAPVPGSRQAPPSRPTPD
jgi:hypothetical protein